MENSKNYRYYINSSYCFIEDFSYDKYIKNMLKKPDSDLENKKPTEFISSKDIEKLIVLEDMVRLHFLFF